MLFPPSRKSRDFLRTPSRNALKVLPASESNEVSPFNFEGKDVRVIADKDGGEPWFVAADVCAALGISNGRDALTKLDADEKGVGSTDTPGGTQQVSVISESGLYALILRCRDAMTPGTVPHRFRKWVTSIVLPSVRKTGSYEAAELLWPT